MESIYFKDQSAPQFKLLVIAAMLCALLAALFFFFDLAAPLSLTAAALSVVMFAFTGIDNFKHTNLVNHDTQSVTVKLLGRKTFGFRYAEVEQVSLSEKGLLITFKGREPVTLSRKRYKEQSLIDFKQLILKYK